MTRPVAGLRPGWMLAVVPEGLVVVGPQTEVEVTLDGGEPAARVLATALLSPDVEGGLTGLDDEDRRRLAELLDELGALGPAPDLIEGVPLSDAIVAARAGEPVAGVIWTAEEALLLPATLPSRLRMRALRAFVAGLIPDGRLRGYAMLAGGAGAVHGDRPDAAALAGRLEGVDDGSIVEVVELSGAGRRWHVAPDDLDRIGATHAHRLGPIRQTSAPEPLDSSEPEGLHLCVAEIAVGNLAAVTPAQDRLVQGVGTPDHARLVAHAEGAERYATAEISEAELVRAHRSELPEAIDPRTLYEPASSQPPPEDGQERLWAPAISRTGSPCWVPAEAVYTSILRPAQPSAVLPWTSSGVAAHLDLDAARHRAFCELVERDAFMWTWMQRISRERIRPKGVPSETLRLRALLARHDWTTTWVNLSLDTFPVILCCTTHPQEGLTVGASCAAEPAAALHRATVEALVLALRFRRGDEPIPAVSAVRGPRDHLLFHRDPRRHADHGFLFSADEEIELGDVHGSEGEDLEEQLEGIGCPPLTTDLSLPSCRPYRIIRALAPGLLPITFGAAHEPRGMARARQSLVVRSGQRVGSDLERVASGVMLPHPFP